MNGPETQMTSTFAFFVASVSITAFFSYRFLQRGSSLRMAMFESDFCLWYTVGFVCVFSILLYRTLPRPSPKAVKLGED